MDTSIFILAGASGWVGDLLCPDPIWRWRWGWPPPPGPDDPWPIFPRLAALILAAALGIALVYILGWRIAAASEVLPIVGVGALGGAVGGSFVRLGFLAFGGRRGPAV